MKWIGICFLILLAACSSVPPIPANPQPTTLASTAVSETAAPENGEADAGETNTSDTGRGDPANGERLFNEELPDVHVSCTTCHSTQPDARVVGPSLHGVGERAEEHSNGDPDSYLRESIVNPNAFIAPGEPPYPTGVMPQNYGDVLSTSELEDLIAYLRTL